MNQLKNLITDADRHRMKDLALRLKAKEGDFRAYADTLANLIRRIEAISSVAQKIHRKTHEEIKSCDAIITEIRTILGEIEPKEVRNGKTDSVI